MTLRRSVASTATGSTMADTPPTDLGPRHAALKAAAWDACGVACEIRDMDGALVAANAAARNALGEAVSDGPDHEEVLVEGRAMLIERRDFQFDDGRFRASAALDIDAQRRMQDELFQRAYFDSLTGLPNRELCDRAIGDHMRAARPGEGFAVAILQLDKFNQINAFHGSAIGDALLAKIAARLSGELDSDDLLARSGGDEFCLILAGRESASEIMKRVERLIERIGDPYFIDGSEIFASAAAGVSLWPHDDSSPDGLRQKAKAALADARSVGGVAARLFQPELQRAELGRAKVEMALRAAIRDRRIGCAFQPKFDFRAGAIDSLEVLMRWRDEEGRWNSPGEFLDLAHKVGLTNDITRQVFDVTIDSIDEIDAAFGPGLHLGFNISARQAGDPRFMRGFAEKLGETGLAHRFVLELTEEAFLPASQFQSRVLPMMREIGAKISIDDFGAGYSSLSTLADITADEVKVDRSLITGIDRRPRSQSLLRAIESIGAALGTEVMVEGVETADELAYLEDFTQIRVAQGYFFAKPMLLSEAAANIEPRDAAPRRRPAPVGRAIANSRVVERRPA
jgi:diguanylate cyclase (GGDEF)-like protein